MQDFDYLALYEQFSNLPAYQRKQIARCRETNDLFVCQGFISLLKRNKDIAEKRNQFARMIWFYPFFKEHKQGVGLGEAISKVKNQRLLCVIRTANERRSLEYLKSKVFKTFRHGVSVDINKASKSIFYWGKKNKMKMYHEYLMAQ